MKTGKSTITGNSTQDSWQSIDELCTITRNHLHNQCCGWVTTCSEND